MTTDNKTLADVQPGGTVRLDDGVRCSKCKDRGYFDVDVDVDHSGGSIGNIEACPHCALSAQPSPGGQGDARETFSQWWAWQSDDIANLYAYEIARLGWDGALAARQPVGEPVSEKLMRLLRERAALPESVELSYQRDGDGTGRAWWDRRHAELEAQGYCLDFETDSGAEWYALRGIGDELRAALAEYDSAPRAQAVDLGQMPRGIRLVEIPRRNGLDPINVFVQDYELGRGRIVVTCYGQAWCGFWGAMGDRTVMQFVAACDADYVAGNMLSGRHEHVKKHERLYVERIATEVIAEFRALIDSQAVGNG